ncbi:hypothetical protein SLE2022_307870 [Rubroshorea leprosula]
MGIGLSLSWMAMVISATVESIKRGKVIQEGNSMDMSAMWLLPQYCLLGSVEAFTTTEFFYTELPRSMSSIVTALLLIGILVTNWLSGVVLNVVSDLTSRGMGGRRSGFKIT